MLFSAKIKFYQLLASVLKLAVRFISISNPILFSGKNASLELCDAIAQRGHKHLLLVTDDILMELKLADKMIAHLENQKVKVTIYSGVLPDPTTDQVAEGTKKAQQNNCDGIIAFGGGSSIDAGKAISACIPNKKTAKELSGFFKVKKLPLPLYVVPTTAGTGSEATLAAVISDNHTHKKELLLDSKLIPKMAALDGELMLNLPNIITAATGMDALTHAIEAYISTNATDETNELALTATKLIFNNLETAVSNGNDFQARQNMAMGSYYAGAAFTRAGVGYVHAISHNIGATYGTPHGVANAMILPRILEYSYENIEGRLAHIARFSDLATQSTPDSDAANELIQKIKNMITAFDLPYYLDDLRKSDIPSLAQGALKEAHYTFYAVPKYLDQLRCESILHSMIKT